MQRSKLHLLATAFAAAVLLAGCGGGSDAGPRVAINRVVVAGDSLADSGTFGFRFTVQNSADPANPFPVFSEIVARNYGVNTLCPAFVATGANSFSPTLRAGCTNFAVGDARIQLDTVDANPDQQERSVPFQLATAGQAVGTYTATDLVLVEGGGNDANDLVGFFLRAAAAGANSQEAATYRNFLLQQIDQPTLDATLAQPNGAALAAGLYMQRLADTYYDAVQTNALNRGATHVAVLNMTDVTVIPAFQAAAAGASAAAGGGTAGAAAVAQLKGVVTQWLTAFNNELAARVGTDARVAIVPFFADTDEEIGNPAAFGVTNATDTACGRIGITTSAGTCTSAALDANPPPNEGPGWWTTWAFADPLHPTPFGHQLLAASVNRALARAGWL